MRKWNKKVRKIVTIQGVARLGDSPRDIHRKERETNWGHKSHTYIKIFTQRGTVPKPDQTVNRHPLNAYGKSIPNLIPAKGSMKLI